MGLQNIRRMQVTYAVGAVTLIAAAAPVAHASLVITLVVNGVSVSMADDGPFDSDPTVGTIDANTSALNTLFAPMNVQFTSLGATSNASLGTPTSSTSAMITQNGSVHFGPAALIPATITVDTLDSFAFPATPAVMSQSAADTFAFTQPGQSRTFRSFFDRGAGNEVDAPLDTFTPPVGPGPFGTSNPGQTTPLGSQSQPFTLGNESLITLVPPSNAATPETDQFSGITIVAVPEPATLGVLGIAAVGLLANRKRRV